MRQSLRLVQDDHAVCDVVQLPAAGRAVGEETLEELHGGGHDHRRIPVFHCQLELVQRFPTAHLALVERTVVFHNEVDVVVLSECVPKYSGSLFDDGRERQDVDHAVKIVRQRVAQGERQRRESLASPCRNRQHEHAGFGVRLVTHMLENRSADCVHFARGRISQFAIKMPVQSRR